MKCTENLNIRQFKALMTPDDLKRELPETEDVANVLALMFSLLFTLNQTESNPVSRLIDSWEPITIR